ALFVYNRKMQEQRVADLQIFAAQNGWTYVPDTSAYGFLSDEAYSLLNQNGRVVISLLQKTHDDGEAYVFDYEYKVNRGKSQRLYQQTVAAFYTPHLNLPFFALYPESFFSFVGEMFGYNDIDFATHPTFSETFKLSGQDEINIRKAFHAQA